MSHPTGGTGCEPWGVALARAFGATQREADAMPDLIRAEAREQQTHPYRIEQQFEQSSAMRELLLGRAFQVALRDCSCAMLWDGRPCPRPDPRNLDPDCPVHKP